MLVIDQKPELIEMSSEYAVLDENGQRLGSVVDGTIHAARLLQPRRFTIVDHADSEVARIIRTTASLERAIVSAETYTRVIDKPLAEGSLR
ncbi:hypothetical protein ACQP2U_18080 [Nocardia sp. CA-084685]|uniref:hypothetical protein n=1 Tax=Nocardia sp. CA-084685 TaxID=3239970 RepID=UPI003D9573A0